MWVDFNKLPGTLRCQYQSDFAYRVESAGERGAGPKGVRELKFPVGLEDRIERYLYLVSKQRFWSLRIFHRRTQSDPAAVSRTHEANAK
jgi:hypothetical protein